MSSFSPFDDGQKLSAGSGGRTLNPSPPGHHAHTHTTQLPQPPQHFLWRVVVGVKVQSALDHHRCIVVTVGCGSKMHNGEISFYL